MISRTFSLVAFLLLGGLQLVNAQTTITAFVPVAGANALPTPAGVQGTDQFAPIGVLSNGKVVFTDHAVATVPGAGVGNFDGIVAQGSNDYELTAVVTAQVDGATGVVNVGESCSFAAASASGAQPTGKCAVTEDITLLGQGKAVHTATTIAVTRSVFTTITVPSALPTLSDASLHLKGGANGLRVTFASIWVGVAFGAAKIWL
ncbi:hypothetical protein DFH08DRAFT_1071798 [Mycena albidolilacea]|uniref:Uncharacterized protein n=1 Tax=Mycena albidolilacea TaxID=1033008 RepID=A0AAD7F4R3_9AGAR|nr:hypothetical protein DFH08DRAFT_1071798 [Mycena albidolilacea]